MSAWDTVVLQTAPSALVSWAALGHIAAIVGGLMYASLKDGPARILAGIVFGIGLAICAERLVSWRF